MKKTIILLFSLLQCSVVQAAEMRALSTLCPDFDTVVYGQVLESRFLCENGGCQVSLYSIKPHSKDTASSILTVASPARLHTGDYVVAFVKKSIPGRKRVLAGDSGSYYETPQNLDYTAAHDSVFIYESDRYYREVDLLDTITVDSLRQENCPVASCEVGKSYLVESNFASNLKACHTIKQIGGW